MGFNFLDGLWIYFPLFLFFILSLWVDSMVWSFAQHYVMVVWNWDAEKPLLDRVRAVWIGVDLHKTDMDGH